MNVSRTLTAEKRSLVGSQIQWHPTFLERSAASLSQIGALGNFVVFSTALVLTVLL